MKRFFTQILILTAINIAATAQEKSNGEDFFDRMKAGMEASAEASATASSGEFAPLWLSSNRQGTVSPYANSAYGRVALIRSCDADSLREWRMGYGLDIQVMRNAQSNTAIHQAYVDLQWKKLLLTIGQKEREIDLRNNHLTSGGLSQGINARPIPEALLTVDYFSVPLTDHWWKMRGRIGFGKTTDGNWQGRWIGDPETMRYTSNTLYHEKVIYWKFGREERFPLTFEIGLQMQTQFGGTLYHVVGRNTYDETVKMGEGLSDFWHALWPMGSMDVTDGAVQNAVGNTIGSYNMALTWNGGDWYARAYFERMFEDQSMLTVQYGIYDHLLGFEVQLPQNPYVRHFLVEHLSTKDQSGAVYHDVTASLPDHFAGRDDYYNHGIYTGWQHWGMSLGTPLLLSPIYNADHEMRFKSNRMQAWHVGLDGSIGREIDWRAMATWTSDWGTYDHPLDDVIHQQHYLLEATYRPQHLSGWRFSLAGGYSHGKLLGNTVGATLTVRKSLKL